MTNEELSKMTKSTEWLDYMGRQLEIGKEDEYSEISCYRCGEIISYCMDDNSLSQTFCTKCFDEIFPSEESE